MSDKKIVSCPKCKKRVKVPTGKFVKFNCPNCHENLEFDDRELSEVQKSKDETHNSIGDTIIKYLSYLFTIPLYIFLHKILPSLGWIFHLDRLLLFLLIIAVIRIVLHLFKKGVIIGFVCLIFYLLYSNIWGEYGFKNLFSDYKYMLYSLVNSPQSVDYFSLKTKNFANRNKILDAIDYNNPEVRNYAVSATRKNFLEYQNNNKFLNDSQIRTTIQSFAVFKEINNNWNYVSDSEGHEYFSKASETVKHLSGDCDDHSIFMSACIKAIGGTIRLVRTTGHLYPELFIGSKSDLEKVNYIVKKNLFIKESEDKKTFYHIDENGKVWLNLDYTEKYPGGKFMHEEILGTLVVDN